MILPGRFDIVYADPPWRFSSNSKARPGRNPMRHYPCMTDQEICDLVRPGMLAKDALLIMWTTSPMLVRSLRVVDAWGFTYKSQLVWVKDRIGTGFWARNRHEIVIIATRGKFKCGSPAPFSDSVIEGQQREHSRKPDILADTISRNWPCHRKLELFARTERPGWEVWGNETDKFGGDHG